MYKTQALPRVRLVRSPRYVGESSDWGFITVIYTDGGCDDNRKSRVTRTLRSTGAQAYDQKPAAGWGFCVFEMAPGDSSAGLVRLKPIAELLGPVVTDEVPT